MQYDHTPRTRITGPTKSSPTQLSRPVEVLVKTKAQCRDDPDLENFSVTDGPAAAECKGIITNLLDGRAVAQTVGFLKECGTGSTLGIVSVRPGGNAQTRMNPFTPPWLKRLAVNPYVGLLARDDRFYNTELLDGTRLSTALVRLSVELVTPPGKPPPTMFAFVKRDNTGSLSAFSRLAFHAHSKSRECEQEVLVRRAGKALPPAPDRDVYRAVCITEGSLAA